MLEDKNEGKNAPHNDSDQQSFPKTTARMIGWKASKASGHAYGIPESRARRKCDVLRVLQWPLEGM